jgi:UDP-N-acetylglucosamine--N-acetylmuramyl-(pentapeptide) pyrophosphoryl-undecaprenol N-acetylglucosamine transferase
LMEEQEGLRLIVSGGGTGGHLFPGIAVAETFLANGAENKVLFIGTERHTDIRVLAGRNFQTASISCQGLKGKSVGARIKSLCQQPFSLLQAKQLIAKFKPDLVLGVGGYVTGPVLLAARLMGIATCIQEQNSVPGLANRIIGKFVDRVFISFPQSKRYFPKGKCMLSGNPVRKELINLIRLPKTQESAGETLLVLGGSLGAHKVNMLVIEALEQIKQNLPEAFRVIHQTGKDDEQKVSQEYSRIRIDAEVAAFFDDMASVYKEADVIISRAGATTLAEMTVLAKPMVLIPYPYAADDHQRENGQFLVDGGAARMFVQGELEPKKLAEEIIELFSNAEKRKRMAEAARRLGKADAVDVIVKEIIALASGHKVN